MITPLMSFIKEEEKILAKRVKHKEWIKDVINNYDLIGLAAANEFDNKDLRRFHPSKNDLVELQKFAQSSTKPTLTSLDGDEEPFMDLCSYITGR